MFFFWTRYTHIRAPRTFWKWLSAATVNDQKWTKVCRVRRIGNDCTSGDKRSQSIAIQIDTAKLVSQTATLRRPRALLPAIIGCDLFSAHKTVRDASPACLLPLPAAATCYRRLLQLLPLLALRKPGPRSLGFGGHSGENLSNQTLAGLVTLWSMKKPRFAGYNLFG